MAILASDLAQGVLANELSTELLSVKGKGEHFPSTFVFW